MILTGSAAKPAEANSTTLSIVRPTDLIVCIIAGPPIYET
ncbi:MAG: hypothetical protein OJF50_002166 [Nitrospira sp.]|nr:hypothetical protein [Nitrospira sp.]